MQLLIYLLAPKQTSWSKVKVVVSTCGRFEGDFLRRKPMKETHLNLAWPRWGQGLIWHSGCHHRSAGFRCLAETNNQGRLLGHKMRVKPCQVAEIGRVNFHKMLNGQKDVGGQEASLKPISAYPILFHVKGWTSVLFGKWHPFRKDATEGADRSGLKKRIKKIWKSLQWRCLIICSFVQGIWQKKNY